MRVRNNAKNFINKNVVLSKYLHDYIMIYLHYLYDTSRYQLFIGFGTKCVCSILGLRWFANLFFRPFSIVKYLVNKVRGALEGNHLSLDTPDDYPRSFQPLRCATLFTPFIEGGVLMVR